ncbi:MAG: hypothetical protein ABSE18_04150 [Minisyncoccia bacterium]|jgi:hypothetical protein
MPKKIKATKTINPLHFEDLEPHRFEDLVRRLLYSFKDWKEIEPTGRAGSDEGFDVRAWENGEAITNLGEEGEEGSRVLEGRLWQIQGKREKSITPAKMRTLIKDGVDGANPPYGYILAAATNISKSTYDAFREELKKKGVIEFHFWGKDYLEDQLSLPQNDEILFTFFGLSLSPRRRSRTTELKFNINNKNKIQKLIFGTDRSLDASVPRGKAFLLRDIKAEHYPYKGQYPDFEKNRRWEEHDVIEVAANGVVFKIREWYAYLDKVGKKWDYSTAVDLTLRKENIDKTNQARLEDEGKKVERFWRHLPRRFQAKLILYGFVRFEDMLIIDDKGDVEHADPHIYIDFSPKGPFQYQIGNLVQEHHALHESEFQKFERIKIFPSTFPGPIARGTSHDISALGFNEEALKSLKYFRAAGTLYSFDNQLKALEEGNLIHFPAPDQDNSEKYAEVTHVHETTVGALLKEKGSDSEYYRSQLKNSAGREVKDKDKVVIYEIQEVLLPYSKDYLIYRDNDLNW